MGVSIGITTTVTMPAKYFINGKRNILAKEFRKIAPDLAWTKHGILLHNDGKKVAPGTVLAAFGATASRRIYEDAFRVVAQFGADSFWYEGRRK